MEGIAIELEVRRCMPWRWCARPRLGHGNLLGGAPAYAKPARDRATDGAAYALANQVLRCDRIGQGNLFGPRHAPIRRPKPPPPPPPSQPPPPPTPPPP